MQKRLKGRNSLLIAALVMVSGIALTAALIAMGEEEPETREIKQKTLIPAKKIVNRRIQTIISVLGHFEAAEKISIHSEVTGILQNNSQPFLEGIRFKKGDTILKIGSEQHYHSLFADKNSFLNTLLKLMPDLKHDYPENFRNWKLYISDFDINKPLHPLPVAKSRQEKYFLTTNGIYQSYYRTVSQEALLKKYTIKAPFNGMVIQSSVQRGTLIQPGQKLGEFIGTDRFYLKSSVSQKQADLIKKGQVVRIRPENITEEIIGKVERINNPVDSATQQVSIYITVNSNLLRQGMFADGVIETDRWIKGIKIPRHLIHEDQTVDTVEKNRIVRKKVQIASNEKDGTIITGLSNNTVLSLKNDTILPGTEVETVLK